MAAFAGELLMRPFEGKPGLFEVIEGHLIPAHLTVAVIAHCPASAFVDVIEAVTANAVGRWLFALHVGQVATGAIEFAMRAKQREIRFGFVIEALRLPPLCVVATLALDATRSVVHVVQAMTGHAFTLEVGIDFTNVAGPTGHVSMQTSQRKVGFVMVEVNIAPGRRVVATLAAVLQRIAMR